MSFEIEGEYNTATVHTSETIDEAEDKAVEQIKEMVNHEAFSGDANIEIQADYHWGAGAIIGFTMGVEKRICPNTVGLDVGCGMYAVNLGRPSIDFNEKQKLHEVDQEIRKRVPVGFDTHDRNDYHMINDFPYTTCEQKWDRFAENTQFDLPVDEIQKYPRDSYFSDVCSKVEYDQTRAINSLGTCGGGNHFVELGFAQKSGDLWAIIHSGSRGIGAEIAQYWQDRATTLRSLDPTRGYMIRMNQQYGDYIKFDPQEVSDEELLNWVQGGMGEDFVDYEALKRDYKDSDPEKIEEISSKLKEVLKYADASNRNTDLDYLEGREAHGYIKDMIFAQTYASESRKKMAEAVREAVESVTWEDVAIQDSIESVHNYIDFNDGVIRKGACRAHEGERLIVPFNMNYGTLICEGKGRNDWNNSAPHGAGRAMSRTEAKNRYDEQDMEEQTGDTYLSVKPVDECPKSYKSPELIEKSIGPTAEVIDRVKPILSVKAE